MLENITNSAPRKQACHTNSNLPKQIPDAKMVIHYSRLESSQHDSFSQPQHFLTQDQNFTVQKRANKNILYQCEDPIQENKHSNSTIL